MFVLAQRHGQYHTPAASTSPPSRVAKNKRGSWIRKGKIHTFSVHLRTFTTSSPRPKIQYFSTLDDLAVRVTNTRKFGLKEVPDHHP